MPEQLTIENIFPTLVYTIDKPEFLDIVRPVALEFLEQSKERTDLNDIYPVYMTENLDLDSRMLPFSNYVAQTAWNILQDQGFDVENITTHFESIWCQEHYKHSSMEQHVHGNGVQIVGFYFLDSPEKCSKLLFHDPRPAKAQINLPELNNCQLTPASIIANYEPTPGKLIFSNSWLPHSFTKNGSEDPMRFIHFNISVKKANTATVI
jgi:uncharacterized protein (TIGR02466 family)